jgi:hypothetical protein
MDHSPAQNAPNTSNVDTSSLHDKIADGDLEVLYCPTEIMWANVLTKPNRSHLMNVPINYDDDTKCLKTHPLLLLLDEHPVNPKQIKD